MDKGRSPGRQEPDSDRKNFIRIARLVNDAVVLVDGQRKIVYLNLAAERLFGYRSRDVVGQEFHRKIVPALRGQAYTRVLWQHMRPPKDKYIGRSLELDIRRRDGELIPVELTISRCRLDGLPFTIGILRDTSRRKRAEKLLRESEEKFRNLAEQSPNMIFINQRGRVVYANAKCEEIMGYKRAEFYAPGFDFRTLIAPEFARVVEKNYRLHLRDKERKPFEYALVTKDGRRIEALFTTRLINYGGERAILGIITDVTDYKRAERELRESKALLENVFAGMKEVVGIVDLKTRTAIMTSPAVERVFGYKAEEVIGRNTSFMFASPKEYRAFGKKYGNPGRGKTITVPYRMRRKDGRIIPTEHTVSVIEDKARRRTIGINVMRDMTLPRRIEDQSREYQEKLRTLAAELSQTEERERRRIAKNLHDHIGQNLALIRIKMGEFREKMRDAADRRSLEDIRKLVENTIRYTRSLTFELSPPLLYEVGLVAAVEWLAEHTRQQSRVDVRVRSRGRLSPLNENMRVFLFNAARELLLNVVKHARARRVSVDLSRKGSRITLSVRDDGLGITPARAEPHRRRAGFGLFSIRERVNNYGGGMTIAGRPGRGTVISLWVPAEPERSR
jgi:PAS domain S-box-containing protein